MDSTQLYIQVRDGLPINHPAYGTNLIDAFGEIPSDWEPFTRVPNPAQQNDKIVLTHPEPTYRKIDGAWVDCWLVRDKTPEELAADKESQLAQIQEQWSSSAYLHNFTAWVLNEETMVYEPPIPRPTDGLFYRWSGPDNNWKLAEPFPNDGKKYYFDFDNWVNVEMA